MPKLRSASNQEKKSSLNQQNELDKKLVHSLNTKKIPSLKQIKHLPKIISLKERRMLSGLLILIIVSIIFIGVSFYRRNFIPLPTVGGDYTEGLIGAPQYINPLLSQTNDVDSDITHFIFSGLLKYDKNLQVVPDLAERWQVDETQTAYTFILKENIKWHDGEPLTANDIIFTIKSIQDSDFKSPLLVSLRGVEVKKIDEKTISFILPEPYPAFLEVLTFGILPEHIWGEIPPINANLTEYNLKPVGSGPWQFKSLAKDRLGNIKSYTIVPNSNYYDSKPYLEQITFKFYPDFQTGIEALKNNSVEGLSFLPKDLKKELSGQKNLNHYSFSLPQYTAIFLNQKANEALKEKTIRKALALAIDKPAILSEALQLEGEIINGPILPGFINEGDNLAEINFNFDEANNLLDQAGWKRITPEQYHAFLAEQTAKAEAEAAEAEEKNNKDNDEAEVNNAEVSEEKLPEELPLEEPLTEGEGGQEFFRQSGDEILTIKLTTVDQPENIKAAGLIKQFWQAAGVIVHLEIIEGSRISREIIKPRNYQALLFGIIVGSDPDPYPFWHSSQAQDPGLNLAMYANRKVDKLLEDARKATNEEAQQENYQQFRQILIDELPAIFLYNPTYTYVADKKIKGLNISRIIIPADRFNNLNEWYIKTKRTYKGSSQ